MPPSNDNPGWTPEIAMMLIAELRKLYEVQRETVFVQRELRDELARLRTTLQKLEHRLAS